MKKRYSEEQIIRILREAEASNVPIRNICKQHNISEQTFYRWRDKFGGTNVPDARTTNWSTARCLRCCA